MASQKTRGSKWAEIAAIRDTLKLALSSYRNEQQLRRYIQAVVNSLDKRVKELDPDRKNVHANRMPESTAGSIND